MHEVHTKNLHCQALPEHKTTMHATPLPDLVILLAAAVVIVTAFRSLRVSPVLGYLVAGALIGPKGFAVIKDLDTTAAIAELGIVFLLFMIGLELSFDRLKAMRRKVFGIGTAQLLVTGGLFIVMAKMMGQSPTTALIVGSGLALSSTALVLQVLQQQRELASQTGRLSLAILILQDLAVLPLLVLVPALAMDAGGLGHALLISSLRALLALVVITIIGRLMLRPLFRLVAALDIHELFVAVTLLVVLGLAWLTESIGLSMALGAFLAGLLVAETEFQHQVEADVLPYKQLLMGLFFMTVGMKIDAAFIYNHAAEIILGAVALIAIKGSVLYAVLRAFRYSKRTCAHTALLLAQGGEFGFILFGLAGQLGVIEESLVRSLLLVIALTMAATPLLDMLGVQFEKRWWHRVRTNMEQMAQESLDLTQHVVIAGYGRMGQLIADYLASEKVPFIALDTNPREVAAGRKRHHPVYFGNAARPEVLESIGVARAQALILTLHERDAATELLKIMRIAHPNLPIFVRAYDSAHCKELEALGATYAVPELEVSGKRLLANLLGALGRPEDDIQRVMAMITK
jgi:CPA2 family monovalent cation:H+ antiporter-2